MKKLPFIIVLLLVGFLIGWSAPRVGRASAAQQPGISIAPNGEPKSSNQTAQQKANADGLAHLYPAELVLQALKDMRVITLLDGNDVVMARKVLVLDLESRVSSLAVLRQEIQLSEFDSQALKDAEAFLEKSTK